MVNLSIFALGAHMGGGAATFACVAVYNHPDRPPPPNLKGD